MSSLSARLPPKGVHSSSASLDTEVKKPKRHKPTPHETNYSVFKQEGSLEERNCKRVTSEGHLRPNERGSAHEQQMLSTRSYRDYKSAPILHRTSHLSQLSWCTSQCLKLVTAILVLSACRHDRLEVYGQRAPCYECEVYRDSHPHTNPYEQIRARCEYPCECQRPPPSCPPGEALVQDACGCCWKCENISSARTAPDGVGRKSRLSDRETFFGRGASPSPKEGDSQFKADNSKSSEEDDSQPKTDASHSKEEFDSQPKKYALKSPVESSQSKTDASQTTRTPYRLLKGESYTSNVTPGSAAEGAICGPHRACAPGYVCRYSTPGTTGTCKEEEPKPCLVNGTSYEDGQSFRPDCRTECTCRSSTYACASLCPGEALPPSARCRNPRLKAAAGTCCRQWACDPDPDGSEPSKDCDVSVSRWSLCSSVSCGLGLSQRWATDRQTCRPALQTRLCQLRPCAPLPVQTPVRQIRRGRHCKATVRSDHSHRLVAGPCVSQRRYRPKQCNACVGSCCSAFHDTSLQVAFLCPLHGVPPYLLPDHALSASDQAELFETASESETQRSRLGDLTDEGEEKFFNVTASNYEVVQKQVQWIVRCRCAPTCLAPTVGPAELASEESNSAERVELEEMESGTT